MYPLYRNQRLDLLTNGNDQENKFLFGIIDLVRTQNFPKN